MTNAIFHVIQARHEKTDNHKIVKSILYNALEKNKRKLNYTILIVKLDSILYKPQTYLKEI